MMSTTPLERFATGLYQTSGDRPVESGSGWQCRCPAHDDTRPSLSLSVGEDGRLLIHCHAGCTPEAICRAVGLRMADLMPEKQHANDVSVSRTRRLPKKTGVSLTDKPARRLFATADHAIADLERQHGSHSASWTYHDAHGEPVGVVVRWDQPAGGKDIRPISRNGEGWFVGGMSEPRPLYCLPDLAGAERVYVTEGEKATDAIRSLGLIATTSPHGAKSAAKADWSALAGKNVIVLPDSDPPGRVYAETVAGILARLTPAPTVRIVELPDLPAGGDAVEWVAAGGTRADLERLADAVEPATPLPADSPPVWESFPADALPEPVCGIVQAAARAIGCDVSLTALPVLAVLAACVGNRRRIRLKPGWLEPPIIWCAIVGDSGTLKTPAFRFALQPLRDIQGAWLREYQTAAAEYDIACEFHKKQHAEWNRSKTGGDPPVKPTAPTAQRIVVSDTTVEALAPMLLDNPCGVLLARDELAGWIGSFDRYAARGQSGADGASWLSMHGGESITVDRKTGVPRTIYVPSAAVSVCGCIQPGILQRVMHAGHRESGLLARLLLAHPPRRAKQWTDAGISPSVERTYADLARGLLAMEPGSSDDGQPAPLAVPLSPDGKRAFVEFYNLHAREQADLYGDESAAWSKMEGYCARLALVIHCVRQSIGELPADAAVDDQSVGSAVRLIRWFANETRRVYSTFGETDADRDARRLVEWIERQGGSTTPGKVQAGCRWLREPGAAEAAIDSLAEAGFGAWESTPAGPAGGRPARAFRLRQQRQRQQNPRNPAESLGFADADNADAPESQSAPTSAGDDDWGTV